jgi:signal recognition particle subunit SRP54
MFEALTQRLEAIFDRLRGAGRLSEENIQEALREVRVALLEADVNFRVVKSFVERVRERAIGQEVLRSLTPGQQVVKIVHDELVTLLGAAAHRLAMASHPPTVIMVLGLQGSGKTTTVAKLGRHFQREGFRRADDVWTTNDVGMLKGLVQSGVPLGAWKEYLRRNPFDVKRAFVASRTTGRLLPETVLGRPSPPPAIVWATA